MIYSPRAQPEVNESHIHFSHVRGFKTAGSSNEKLILMFSIRATVQ